jgi:hypothetical protein
VTSSTQDRIGSNQSSFSLGNDKWLLPRKQLKEIAGIFEISKEKIKELKGNDWGLQNKCFKKITRYYENEGWGKNSRSRQFNCWY